MRPGFHDTLVPFLLTGSDRLSDRLGTLDGLAALDRLDHRRLELRDEAVGRGLEAGDLNEGADSASLLHDAGQPVELRVVAALTDRHGVADLERLGRSRDSLGEPAAANLVADVRREDAEISRGEVLRETEHFTRCLGHGRESTLELLEAAGIRRGGRRVGLGGLAGCLALGSSRIAERLGFRTLGQALSFGGLTGGLHSRVESLLRLGGLALGDEGLDGGEGLSGNLVVAHVNSPK